MKHLLLLLILLSLTVSARFCSVDRVVEEHGNNTYLVSIVGSLPMNEVTIYDSAYNVSLASRDYWGFTCRHTDYIMGRNVLKIYVPGEVLSLNCSYFVHGRKPLTFKGYMVYYYPGYGLVTCDIRNKTVSTIPSTTSTTKKPTTTTQTTSTTRETTTTTQTTQETTSTTQENKQSGVEDTLDIITGTSILVGVSLIIIYQSKKDKPKQ